MVVVLDWFMRLNGVNLVGDSGGSDKLGRELEENGVGEWSFRLFVAGTQSGSMRVYQHW